MIVINTQHNPTGTSWTQEFLFNLIKIAIDRNIAILLDDPYYLVTTNDVKPVSSPAVLFEYFSKNQVPENAQYLWCQVTSFGKAFNCNDWGIGTIMAHPDTLKELSRYSFRWTFPRASRRQWAMAKWVTDPACEQYLARQRDLLTRKRNLWSKTLQQLGWPAELTPTGSTTPYYLIAIPRHYLDQPDGINQWRQDLLNTTGLLFAHASVEEKDQEGTVAKIPFLRVFLGGGIDTIVEATRRLKSSGIRYY